jgi:hypothetical protein
MTGTVCGEAEDRMMTKLAIVEEAWLPTKLPSPVNRHCSLSPSSTVLVMTCGKRYFSLNEFQIQMKFVKGISVNCSLVFSSYTLCI